MITTAFQPATNRDGFTLLTLDSLEHRTHSDAIGRSNDYFLCTFHIKPQRQGTLGKLTELIDARHIADSLTDLLVLDSYPEYEDEDGMSLYYQPTEVVQIYRGSKYLAKVEKHSAGYWYRTSEMYLHSPQVNQIHIVTG